MKLGRRRGTAVMLLAFAICGSVLVGCEQPPPIRQYTISTEIPDALRSQDRMLGAIIPQDDEVWFFKLVGPATATEAVAADIRRYLTQVEFVDGKPDLSQPPDGWQRSRDREMRFATLAIPTADRELELAVSQLPKSGDWDEQVAMNVNRWRGQLQLPASDARWAGAELLAPGSATGATGEPAVWVDLTGEMGAASPMAGMAGMSAGPLSGGQLSGGLPPGHPELPANGGEDRGAAAASDRAAPEVPGLSYDAPENWRPGKRSMMRLAAFEIGPPERFAELTIIQAGGDLRGNVDRWIGQVRDGSPPADVVDAALAAAERLNVSGLDAQRFYLTAGPNSPPDAQAIDATIVPLPSGMSWFIKATGPAATLEEQRAAIGEFLESLSLPE